MSSCPGGAETSLIWGSYFIFIKKIRTVPMNLRNFGQKSAQVFRLSNNCLLILFPFQGCLAKVSSLASEYTSMIILVIISVLTVEIVVIILACCLCFLQKYRRDKNCQRIIVTKETSQQQNQQERNNWNNSSLRDERRNLIYTEAMNDGVP